MIIVNKKILKEIWWLQPGDNVAKYALCKYRQANCEFKDNNCYSMNGQTLITDLSLNQDELLMSFNSTVRNAIRRIERDGAEIKIYNSAELKNKEIIKQFIKTFNINYKTLGLKYRLKKMPINAYINSNAFYLSIVYYKNQPIIFHSYIANESNCHLLHSASYCRTEKNVKFEITRNEIGMYNRYLHWKDMLYFKDKDVKTYNWGGISSYENPNGIDKFKMQFNGKFANDTCVLVANNLIGMLVRKIYYKRSLKYM